MAVIEVVQRKGLKHCLAQAFSMWGLLSPDMICNGACSAEAFWIASGVVEAQLLQHRLLLCI